MDKLQLRWGVSGISAVKILLVFALTGCTVMWMKQPILDFILQGDERHLTHSILYYVLILPLYNLVLLVYGLLLGEFKFFWEFEKRFINRIRGHR